MDEEEFVISFGDDWIENTIRRINAPTDADTNGSNESLKISKPPQALLDVRPESYRPQLLTIGPLHGILSDSASADRCKELCVWRFMQRQEIPDVKQLMQRLFDDPRSFLDTHYSNPLDYSLERHQLMLTLDSIFIYEFFLSMCATDPESKTEQNGHFQTLWKNNIIVKQFSRDLFLMGNQIPMSFLKKLIEDFPRERKLELGELNRKLRELIKIVDPFLTWNFEDENSEIPDFCKCSHLLDCLYVWVCREPLQKNGSDAMNLCSIPQLCNLFWRKQEPRQKTIFGNRLPTASRLSKASIRFRVIVGSISVMKYDKTNLRFDLPRLIVNDRTEDVLRNLLAHEQSSKSSGDFTKYVAIMNSLIDTPEDVAILTKAQVIENYLGSDEKLVEMWNNMCTNVDIRACERWDDMTHDVLDGYENPGRSMAMRSIFLSHG